MVTNKFLLVVYMASIGDWEDWKDEFTCVSCKRYFNSHYFDTGPGGCFTDDEDGNPILDENGEPMPGGDSTDGHIPYWYCQFCDRKGGNSPDNPFCWRYEKGKEGLYDCPNCSNKRGHGVRQHFYDSRPWPYPEDITK